MKAVVIHEDMEFAARAAAMLRRVGGRTEINVEWTVLSWAASALSGKKFAQRALVQAQDAHLIVLPAKLARFIPLSLLDWLERWATLRQNPEVALGILDDSDPGHIEGRVHPALLKFVHQHGLAANSNGSHWPNNGGKLAALFETDPQRALPVKSYLHGNFDQPGASRNFGINE